MLETMTSQDDSLEQTVEPLQIAPGEIIIGKLLGFNENGEPQVTAQGLSPDGLSAMSAVAITHQHVGQQLALLFANGDQSQPVIMGLIYSPLLDMLDNIEFVCDGQEDDVELFEESARKNETKAEQPNELSSAYIDGDRVILEGKEEITLKCGEASITLTKAGKILIRGKYLLTRATGVNRIMGGSVQVN